MFFDESHVTPGTILEGVNHNVRAVELLDSTNKIVTLEYEGLLKRDSINVYNSLDGSKEIMCVNKGVSLRPLVAVVSPDQVVLVTCEHGRTYLRVVDISRMVCIGTPVPMPTFHEGCTDVATRLFVRFSNLLSSSRDAISWDTVFWPCALAVFARQGRVVVHDGQSSVMAHRLLSVDVAEGKVCGAVMTWDIVNKAVDVPSGAEDFGGGVENRAEVALVNRACFVTGSRFGWVRRWCATSLSMLNHWQLRLPDTIAPDKQWSKCQIYSLASNVIENRLAVETAAGSIHIVNANMWLEDGPCMIPPEYINKEIGCAVESLSFCANDQLIVAVYGGGVIRVWDVDKTPWSELILADFVGSAQWHFFHGGNVHGGSIIAG